jgi:predicted TIM-barrel fold metal-dependent hydrolase
LTDYSPGLAPAGPGRIDAHVHPWQLSVRDQPCTARLQPLRHDCTLDELRHRLAAAVVRAGVVGRVDLCAADVAGRLASLTEGSGGCWLTGIRHGVQDEHDPDWPVSTLRAGHSRVVGLTAERLGGLSSDGQATMFGATAAAWYGFGATDHDRAGRPCG